MAKGKGKKRNNGGKKRSHPEEPRPKLTLDVLGIIAKILISTDSHGTCAALNVTNKAVYNETHRTLWRIFVKWGAYAYNGIPTARWPGGKDEETAVDTVFVKAAKKQWKTYLASPGAAWIEYLFEPPFAIKPDVPNSLYKSEGPLKRLKANIHLICDQPGDPFHVPGAAFVMINLRSGYQYGSEDLFYLSEAIKEARSAANANLIRAFDSRRGIRFIPPHELPSDHPEVKTLLSLRRNVPRIEFLYQPLIMGILGSPGAAGISETLLELLYWMKDRKPKPEDHRPPMINVSHMGGVKQGLMSAKTYQRALKSDPSLASVFVRFDLGFSANVISISEPLNGLLAIIRGAYLYVSRQAPWVKIGDFEMSIKTRGDYCCWEVRLTEDGTYIETVLSTDDNSEVLHRDVTATA